MDELELFIFEILNELSTSDRHVLTKFVQMQTANMPTDATGDHPSKYVPPHKRMYTPNPAVVSSSKPTHMLFPYRSKNVACTYENSRIWSKEEKTKWLADNQETNARCQMVVYQMTESTESTAPQCKVLMIRSKECLFNNQIKQRLQIIGFPKGHFKQTDRIMECAFRELKEETCLDLDKLKTGDDYNIVHKTPNTVFVRLISDRAKNMADINKCNSAITEVSEIMWVNLTDVEKAMDTNPWQFNKLAKQAIRQLKSLLNS